MSSESSPSPHRSRPRSSRIGRHLRKYRFIRVLRKDRLFAVVFVALALIAGTGLLSVPKIWRVTPSDYPLSPVKISAIDAVQAWSLARTARRAAASGNPEASLYAWRSAAINNPGNPDIHRGTLRAILSLPGVQPENEILVGTTVHWLTSITGTNASDALLIADILDHHGAPDAALQHLEHFPDGTHDSIDRMRARCLVSAERYEEFNELWRRHQPDWAADTNLTLYADAWRVATDDRSEGIAAAVRIKQALNRPPPAGIRAARLLQQGAIRRGLVEDLALAIGHLEKAGASSLADHGYYWRLLAASGRQEEARAQAVAFRGPLRGPRAALRYLEALRFLQLRNEALRFLEANLNTYGLAIDIWRINYDLLAETSRWTELQRLAGSAKILTTRQDPLFAEAVFADYRCARAQDRQHDMDTNLRELVDLELTDPTTAMRIAVGLRTGNRPDAALSLLRANEKTLANHPSYWNEVFATGFDLKDISILRRAVAELVRINPGSPVWKNNRAALLLITSENPTEALQLTLDGITRQPQSVALQINHAIALLQNGRPTEAGPILARIDPTRLPPDATANYHLARAEMLAATGRLPEASQAALLVDRNRLLPQQIDRLERALQSPRASR